MKLFPHRDGNHLTIFVQGRIDGSRCNCFQHFWDAHVNENLASVELDMSALTGADEEGIAALANACASVRHFPVTLVHTPRQVEELLRSRLTVELGAEWSARVHWLSEETGNEQVLHSADLTKVETPGNP